MAEFITNIIHNSLSGLVAGAVTTVGGYAGDAVVGLGNLVENGGKAVGDGLAKKFDSWGGGIGAYGSGTPNPTASSLPRTAVSKRPEGTMKSPKQAEKKSLPATAARKALPAPERKVQTSTPSKGSKKLVNIGASSGPTKVTAKSGKPTIPRKSSGFQKSTVSGGGVSKKVVPEKRSLPTIKAMKKPKVTPSKSVSASTYKGHISI